MLRVLGDIDRWTERHPLATVYIVMLSMSAIGVGLLTLWRAL